MAQLPNTATIKDIIAALQMMECINQKVDLAAVVGSPALSTDDVATIISKLQNAKNTLAANITVKGTTANGSEGVQALANKVGSLAGVKKWASGTVAASASITITGLGFSPAHIIIRNLPGVASPYQTVYSSKGNFRFNMTHWFYQAPDSTFDSTANNYSIGGQATKVTTLFAVNSSGFVVNYTSNVPSGTLEWIAFE